MTVRCLPLHRNVPSWLILLAAVLLLAGAGGGAALARLPVIGVDGCQDDEGCKPAVSTVPQPSILQTPQRPDGKALPEPSMPLASVVPMVVPPGPTGTIALSRGPTDDHVVLPPPGHPPRAPPERA